MGRRPINLYWPAATGAKALDRWYSKSSLDAVLKPTVTSLFQFPFFVFASDNLFLLSFHPILAVFAVYLSHSGVVNEICQTNLANGLCQENMRVMQSTGNLPNCFSAIHVYLSWMQPFLH